MKKTSVHSKPNQALSRRDFLRLLKIVGIEAALLALGGSFYMRDYEPSWVEVRHVKLTLPRLSRSFSGLRLVQISDLHFGGWLSTEYLLEVIQMVIAQAPHLVAITGDFVMGHNRAPDVLARLDELAVTLKTLADQVPVYAVLGNHDYWLSRRSVVKMFHAAGIEDLNNAVRTLSLGGEQLHIAGVDDAMESYADIGVVLSQLPQDGCALLLAHEPDYADLSAETGRFDLQISGHSHGGQVVLPLLGPPILPYLARKYPSGLYKVRDMYQYTNRGIGMTTPYPLYPFQLPARDHGVYARVAVTTCPAREK